MTTGDYVEINSSIIVKAIVNIPMNALYSIKFKTLDNIDTFMQRVISLGIDSKVLQIKPHLYLFIDKSDEIYILNFLSDKRMILQDGRWGSMGVFSQVKACEVDLTGLCMIPTTKLYQTFYYSEIDKIKGFEQLFHSGITECTNILNWAMYGSVGKIDLEKLLSKLKNNNSLSTFTLVSHDYNDIDDNIAVSDTFLEEYLQYFNPNTLVNLEMDYCIKEGFERYGTIDFSNTVWKKLKHFGHTFAWIDIENISLANNVFNNNFIPRKMFSNSKIRNLNLSNIEFTKEVDNIDGIFADSKIGNLDLSNSIVEVLNESSDILSGSCINKLDIRGFSLLNKGRFNAVDFGFNFKIGELVVNRDQLRDLMYNLFIRRCGNKIMKITVC